MTVVDDEPNVDELQDRAAVLAGRLNRTHADLVDLTSRLLEGELWGGGGFRSPEHWLVVRVGLSPSRARDVVRIARRREEIPATVDRLGAGRLSLDQAAVVARLAPASHQQSIAELVEHLTVPQVQRALAGYVFDVTTPAAEGEAGPSRLERAAAPPQVSMTYDDQGRFHLRYHAPAHIGALVEQAVREAKDALFVAGQEEATYGEAMAEVAARSLAAIDSPGRAAHYRVYLHLTTGPGRTAWVNGGGAIPPGLAAQLACDATVQPLWERDGRPVSVGRAQRIVPQRTRRLIEDRDRGCRYPGCTTTRHVEIHHLDPWSKGGSTDYETNLSLCPYHHDGLHRGDFTITADPAEPAGLTFANPHGFTIGPPPPPPPQPSPDPPGEPYPAPTGGTLDLRWFQFPPDEPHPPAQ